MKKFTGGKLVFLLSLTYMTSYLTRINYSAVISEMELATGFSKEALSIAVTCSFVTYGLGQILSGILGDRISPKNLVLVGLGLTLCMNLLLPLCGSYILMAVIWGVNGFAQALMWPPIVKIMVASLTAEEYKGGVVKVSWGSSIGTIIMYLAAPLIISFSSWKGTFYFGAIVCSLVIVFWYLCCPNVLNVNKSIEKEPENNTEKKNAKIFTPVFFTVSCAIIICGILRDGVSVWTPSLISESFGLDSSSGILSGAVLPIFGIIAYEVSLLLYRKWFKNPVNCAGMMFIFGVLGSVILVFALKSSTILSVIGIALLNGAMHGVNLMLIGMLPSFYENTGRVSTVSGILNSFVYLGSAVATYVVAIIASDAGWSVTVLMWLGFAAVGTAICFASARAWRGHIEKINQNNT